MLAVLALALLGPTAGLAEHRVKSSGPPSQPVPPARDGNIAIAQELYAARRAATIEAYDLFIARHPDHALTREARREREQLVRAQSPR